MEKKELAKIIIEKLGGESNISSHTHCSTRLRFDLKDQNEVKKDELENLDEIFSVVEVAGQTQIVVGSGVSYLYNELVKELGSSEGSNNSEKESSKGIISSFIEIVSSLFTPLIDVLIGAGILKGLLSILTATNLLTVNSGTYEILNAAADSLYYFLPVILAITCSRKFETNLFVSVTIGCSLLYPNLTTLYNAGEKISFLGIPVKLTAFQSGVFPIIFAILLLKYVEKLEGKLLPESIRSRLAPFFSLIIVVPVTIIVFGPVGSMLSEGIASVYTSMYNFNPTFAGAFIGALAQVMVVFGIHWGLFPIIFSNIEKYGFDTILAVFGPSIIAQSGATFGVYLKTKNKELKRTTGPTTIMGFFGISEPAIYAVNLKYKKPFIMAIIGGGIGGAIAGASGARAIAVAVAAVPTFPAYFGTGFIGFIVGYFSAFFISTILTYLWGFNDDMLKEEIDKEVAIENNELLLNKDLTTSICLPCDGNQVLISSVEDKVFSTEAMGKSIAIKPSEGILYSPVNGVVEMTMDSKHAYGIKSEAGIEILLHVGIDTVKLNGKGFSSFVKEGDVVLEGDKIATFNIQMIEDEGYDPTVLMIFTNSNSFSNVSINNKEKIHGHDFIEITI